MTNFKDIFWWTNIRFTEIDNKTTGPRINVSDRQILYPQVLLGRYHKCRTQMKCWENDRHETSFYKDKKIVIYILSF